MNIKSILVMATAGITLAACQSKGYQIEGTTEGFENGDTLFLTTDTQGNTPRDTLIVQDGKFTLSGETDSTYICMIYSARNENIGIPFFIEPGDHVYAGEVIGESLRPGNDIVINVVTAKNLTNMRTKSADEKSTCSPAIKMSLEEAMEYIREDEYLEITPQHLRIRKIILDEIERKRARIAAGYKDE